MQTEYQIDVGPAIVPHLDDLLGLWMIEPSRLQSIMQFASGINMQAHLAAAQRTAGEGLPMRNGGDGVRIIDIAGTLTKRGSSFSDAGSTIRIRQAIRAANDDPQIGSIVLAIESPGGTVAGTQELANAVRDSEKPIVAFIEDMGASAAYWVASQARKVLANEPAMVGSIGTYTAVADMSKMADRLGIKVHVISTGAFKGAGTPGAPITDDQLAQWQTLINQTNQLFLDGVAKGRKMSRGKVEGLATGQVWIARDAKANGLIDAIGTIEDAIEAAAGMAAGNSITVNTNSGSSQRDLLLAIEAACPNADAEFLLEQVEAEATPEAAALAWERRVVAQREAERQAELEAARQRAADLANELAELRCKQAVPPGNDPLLEYPTGNGHAYATCPDPLAEFNYRIDETMRERGVDRSTAARIVNRQCPGLTDAVRRQFER